MSKKWFEISNSAQNEIRIFGVISPWEDVNYKSFEKEFKAMAANGSTITLRINCVGGGMVEGFSIVDLIRNSDVKVIGINEGMAASMGSAVFMACDERIMFENATVMIHNPQGAVWGESKQIKEYANWMDQLKDKLVKLYKEVTGQSDKVVNSWMETGVDKYFASDQCVDLGIATKVDNERKALDSLPENLFKKKPTEVFEAYNQYRPTTQQEVNNMELKSNIGVILGQANPNVSLNDKSSDQEVVNAVKLEIENRDKRIADLEKELGDVNASKVTDMVQNAINSGKISAEQKDHYEKLAKADFDSVKSILDGMSGRQDINRQLDSKKDPKSEGRKDWTFEKWSDEDPQGLIKLKKDDYEAFNQLYKAQYGEDYSS